MWLKPGAAQNLLRLEALRSQPAVWDGSSPLPVRPPPREEEAALSPWTHVLFLFRPDGRV